MNFCLIWKISFLFVNLNQLHFKPSVKTLGTCSKLKITLAITHYSLTEWRIFCGSKDNYSLHLNLAF